MKVRPPIITNAAALPVPVFFFSLCLLTSIISVRVGLSYPISKPRVEFNNYTKQQLQISNILLFINQRLRVLPINRHPWRTGCTTPRTQKECKTERESPKIIRIFRAFRILVGLLSQMTGHLSDLIT